jgi:2'-hydroxyisoflavone reductase
VKNVLIIGGSYFVGRIFVEELSKVPGYTIYVMNRGNAPLRIEGVTEIICDRHDMEGMSESIPALMWNAFVDFCAYTTQDIASVLSVLPSHAIGHYIYISTASVYERTHELPVCEDATKVTGPQPGPHGDYAYKKYLAEVELEHLCQDGKIPWTILRPTFIYGKYNYAPRESYFFDLLQEDKTIILPDNELALFTFVAVWDIARAIIGCLGNQSAYAKAFNLAGEELVSYHRLMEVLQMVTEKHLRTEVMSVERIEAQGIPLPFPFDQHLVYNGTLITKHINMAYTPFVDGMKATYEWYRQVRSGKI